MGTLLYARGVLPDACFDALNLNEPKLVQSVHGEYIAAGADCIETNTFGANRYKLARPRPVRPGAARSTCAGAKLARDVRESTGRDVFVLGSIGSAGEVPRAARHRAAGRGARRVLRAGRGAARGRRGRLRRRDHRGPRGDRAGRGGDARRDATCRSWRRWRSRTRA